MKITFGINVHNTGIFADIMSPWTPQMWDGMYMPGPKTGSVWIYTVKNQVSKNITQRLNALPEIDGAKGHCFHATVRWSQKSKNNYFYWDGEKFWRLDRKPFAQDVIFVCFNENNPNNKELPLRQLGIFRIPFQFRRRVNWRKIIYPALERIAGRKAYPISEHIGVWTAKTTKTKYEFNGTDFVIAA